MSDAPPEVPATSEERMKHFRQITSLRTQAEMLRGQADHLDTLADEYETENNDSLPFVLIDINVEGEGMIASCNICDWTDATEDDPTGLEARATQHNCWMLTPDGA